jgi:hypothetical protein
VDLPDVVPWVVEVDLLIRQVLVEKLWQRDYFDLADVHLAFQETASQEVFDRKSGETAISAGLVEQPRAALPYEREVDVD